MAFTIGQSSQCAFNTMMALQIVLREEHPPAATGLLRELERDRVTWRNHAGVLEAQLEVLRAASISHRDQHLRTVMWRAYAEGLEADLEDRRVQTVELQGRIDTATDTLASAVYEVNSLLDPSTRTVVPEVPRAALHRASIAMGTALAELEW